MKNKNETCFGNLKKKTLRPTSTNRTTPTEWICSSQRRIKCQEDYLKLLKQNGFSSSNHHSNDDFNFFHCREKNCHDISLGKTSFRCSQCGLRLCQNHYRCVSELDEYEFDDGFLWILFTKIANKISSLETKLKIYTRKRMWVSKRKNVEKVQRAKM